MQWASNREAGLSLPQRLPQRFTPRYVTASSHTKSVLAPQIRDIIRSWIAIQNLMTPEKTISETLFEEYLFSQGITAFDFEKAWPGVPARPDYTIQHNGATYLFDVKEFKDEKFIPPSAGAFAVDRYGRIREKINQVRSQFKHFKDKPCCLVLYTLDPFVRLQEPFIVLGAMYGDLGFTTLWDLTAGSPVQDSTQRAFLQNGKMFRYESRQPQNQTISALITLRYVRKGDLGVIVWENYLARVPFPREMFCGPYDERWGKDGNHIKRVFLGEGLVAIQELGAYAG